MAFLLWCLLSVIGIPVVFLLYSLCCIDWKAYRAECRRLRRERREWELGHPDLPYWRRNPYWRGLSAPCPLPEPDPEPLWSCPDRWGRAWLTPPRWQLPTAPLAAPSNVGQIGQHIGGNGATPRRDRASEECPYG